MSIMYLATIRAVINIFIHSTYLKVYEFTYQSGSLNKTLQ